MCLFNLIPLAFLIGQSADISEEEEHTVPYVVGLIKHKHLLCAGTFIKQNWVLTAAHCFPWVSIFCSNFFLQLHPFRHTLGKPIKHFPSRYLELNPNINCYKELPPIGFKLNQKNTIAKYLSINQSVSQSINHRE